jgi:catechol 2,3-dioxygenase-like lactoylglutathione lyase family enzyme
MLQIRHLALFVPDLRAAEEFYCRLLDMRLLFREARVREGEWYTLRPGQGWDDVAAVGIEMGMIALKRDDFVLALFSGAPSPGTVVEIGLSLAPEEIEALRGRLPGGAEVVQHEHGDLMFVDPYGFAWHVHPTGEAFVSNAEIDGSWLDL